MSVIEQNKVIIEILKKYPQAVRAEKGEVKIGDIIVNHHKVPALYVTGDILKNFDEWDYSYYWIVAETIQKTPST